MINDEIAILLAAGLGTRMLPLTKTIPKPLIKVQGTPLIETVIEGLERRNVKKIYIVIGYLGEQFQYLLEKYPNIELVENKEYIKKNNISSLWVMGDLLGSANCFICEADLYISETDIFQKAGKESCYYGKIVKGYSDDWVFIMKGKRITHIRKGAKDAYNMVGISYWNKKDAQMIKQKISEVYGTEGHEKLFWDEIVDQLLSRINVHICEVPEKSVVEVDTIEELKELEKGLNLSEKED